jgi:hypothetical protein
MNVEVELRWRWKKGRRRRQRAADEGKKGKKQLQKMDGWHAEPWALYLYPCRRWTDVFDEKAGTDPAFNALT